MKKKEKKRNGIPARTRRGILAACMVFFFSLQFFQGKMLWRESAEESRGKVLSGEVPVEENERTQIIETTRQKDPVSDEQTAQEKEKSEQEREQLLARLYARSAALVDADSGRVLLGKEEHVMRPMASTTKIMTCILALEKGNPKDLVTVSANAVAQPKVHLGMREGEPFYLGDLLYSLMLESHNDSAVAIAEHLAGSVPQFARWMNEKAEEIGCTEAHFVTPNGLDGEDADGVHSISAADLAKIMSYCVLHSPKAAEFLAITQTPAYSFSDAEGKENYSCNNHNAFLQMMDGVISGKTGFTGDAGYCYVGALQSEGRTFVVALLACGWPNNKNYKWADTRKLMEYGMAHYRYAEVWKIPELSKIPVENGVSQNGLFGKAAVELEIKGKESPGKILVGEDDVAEEKTEVPEKLDAPVKSGTPVGQITYLLNGEKWGSCQAVVKETVRRRTFTWIAMKMCEMFYQFNF